MKIIYYGNPVLREVSKEVTEITDEIRQILDEMVETMREESGVGLAANQVGLTQRFFVGEVDGNVKKINGYITRKVADKLSEIFKNDRLV